jgi:hypothetical protein
VNYPFPLDVLLVWGNVFELELFLVVVAEVVVVVVGFFTWVV